MPCEKQQILLQSLPKSQYQQLVNLFQQVKEHGLESQKFNQLYRALHQSQLIFSFNWMDWPPAQQALTNKDFQFDDLSLLELSQHLTAIVRADYYSEGTIVSAYHSGVFEKIFKSMEQKIQAMNN